MNLDEYRTIYGSISDAAPGWDVIDACLRNVYGPQEPKHWGTILKAVLGGTDPIDGISAYENRAGGIDHLHFCTYGYTDLYYNEEALGKDFSKFGFEMIFRLASRLPVQEEPIWVCNLLQNLARYVFQSGKWFEQYHWIPSNGPIRLEYETGIVGLAFVNDPTLPATDSAHGRVEFLQAFGITESELRDLKNRSRSCQDIIAGHRRANPLLITDLERHEG